MSTLPESAVEMAVEAFDSVKSWSSAADYKRKLATAALLAALPALREAVGREYAGLVEAARVNMAKHDAEAFLCNFSRCGCDYCASLRPALTTTQEARHDER